MQRSDEFQQQEDPTKDSGALRSGAGERKLPHDATTDIFHFQHIPELDGFRGLAVLFVLVGHLFEYRITGRKLFFLASNGASLGVLLFFVLSGFLITGLLYRERSATQTIKFRRFYIRRILRLAPALLLFLSTVTALIHFGWITDAPRREILETLFYARNLFGSSLTLSHTWSLSLEEQFYLVWPLIFTLLPMRRCASAVTGACVVFAVWRGVAIAAHLFSYQQGVFYMRPYFRFDSILIGACLVLWLSTSERVVAILKKWSAKVPAAVLWGVLFIWTAYGEFWTRAFYLTVQEILVTTVLAQIVLSESKWLRDIFRWGPLRYCGAISYSLYLWQQLFLVTSVPSWGPLRRLPLSILVPFLIAAASYHLMEKPLLGLKNRLAPQS